MSASTKPRQPATVQATHMSSARRRRQPWRERASSGRQRAGRRTVATAGHLPRPPHSRRLWCHARRDQAPSQPPQQPPALTHVALERAADVVFRLPVQRAHALPGRQVGDCVACGRRRAAGGGRQAAAGLGRALQGAARAHQTTPCCLAGQRLAGGGPRGAPSTADQQAAAGVRSTGGAHLRPSERPRHRPPAPAPCPSPGPAPVRCAAQSACMGGGAGTVRRRAFAEACRARPLLHGRTGRPPGGKRQAAGPTPVDRTSHWQPSHTTVSHVR